MGKEIEPLKENDTVFVGYKNSYHFIRIKDIIFIESKGNYSKVVFNNECVVVHKSLNYLELRLDNIFFRANRKCIINIKMVEKLVFDAAGIFLYMTNGEKVLMSRRQYVLFKNFKTF